MVTYYCLPRCINEDLDWEQSSQDLNWNFNMQCWYHRRLLNSLHSNTSPISHRISDHELHYENILFTFEKKDLFFSN